MMPVTQVEPPVSRIPRNSFGNAEIVINGPPSTLAIHTLQGVYTHLLTYPLQVARPNLLSAFLYLAQPKFQENSSDAKFNAANKVHFQIIIIFLKIAGCLPVSVYSLYS
jgi:hypothetical protein